MIDKKLKAKMVSAWEWFRYEFWYSQVEKRLIDPWYYPVKDFVFPWNRMKIRNVPRSYMEPGCHCLHAVFSLLCRHIEGNEGGRETFVKRIAMLKAEHEKENPHAGKDHALSWYTVSVEMLAAYDFYVGTNWKNPSGFDWNAYGEKHKDKSVIERFRMQDDEATEAVKRDEEIDAQAHRILESLIKTIGYWWS